MTNCAAGGSAGISLAHAVALSVLVFREASTPPVRLLTPRSTPDRARPRLRIRRAISTIGTAVARGLPPGAPPPPPRHPPGGHRHTPRWAPAPRPRQRRARECTSTV